MAERVQLWDRQDGETSKSYAAFCLYRDMPNRNLVAAYRLNSGRPQVRYAPGFYMDWYEAFDWKVRAEAYDTYLEKEARRAREKAHQDELNDFRKRQKLLSQALLATAISVINKTNDRLSTIEPGDIPVTGVASLLRAAAAVAESSTNAEAQVLAVDELLRLLTPDE